MEEEELYPVTITMARYGGVYEPGKWLAFPHDPDQLRQGWDDEDVPCADFWDTYRGWVGAGSTPEEAYADLLERTREVRRTPRVP